MQRPISPAHVPPESPKQQSSESDVGGGVATSDEPTDQNGNGSARTNEQELANADDREVEGGKEDQDEQAAKPSDEATREAEEPHVAEKTASAGKPPSGSRTSLTASTRKTRSRESLRSRSGSSLKDSKSKDSLLNEGREAPSSFSPMQTTSISTDEQKTDGVSSCENSPSVTNAEATQSKEATDERPEESSQPPKDPTIKETTDVKPTDYEEDREEGPKDVPSPSNSPTKDVSASEHQSCGGSHHDLSHANGISNEHSQSEDKVKDESTNSTSAVAVQEEMLERNTPKSEKTSLDGQQKPSSASSKSSARGSRLKLISRSGSSVKEHPMDVTNPSSPVDKDTSQSQSSLAKTFEQEEERFKAEDTA